uniref:Periphilin 1 n=1 Tax=Xiphophorus couchianus TaxID=32473 RepID=A0A3B5MFC9_9TELE
MSLYYCSFTVTYRRDRSIREVYEDRFMQERPGPYPRAAGAVERRGPFGRPEDEYGRGGYEYEGGPRFYPNGGGPRGFHDDQRGYQVEGHHFPERRAIPPARREDFPYRVPREDPHAGRSLEFGARAPPPPSVRSQGVYPAARSLPESGEDTLVQAIRNLDRGYEKDLRKAALFPPLRERSPVRREVARSPHSRSGSSVSSRGYSPDRAKNLPFSTQQGKSMYKTCIIFLYFKVYRQDCETFGMVVKMLVAKDPSLEKQLQVPLRENLGEIRERCLEDLKHFIKELDEDVRFPEPFVCDSVTPAMTQKLLKTGVNHS